MKFKGFLLLFLPLLMASCVTSKRVNLMQEAGKNGIISIKGHRLAGGMRASIYNAMPVEGVKALIEFMKKFELENK